jgi:2-polyprenyl-3-methyl-5-hydroxy-6-metoxy-1,4-benzoquinol methylase
MSTWRAVRQGIAHFFGFFSLSERYYSTARHDVLRFVEEAPGRVLEIGCGTGSTMAVLRSQRVPSQSIGVELDPAAAASAREVFDTVIEGAVEAADFEALIAPGTLDLVLCLDVLEHLVDPWQVVRRVTPLIRPGGRLILSVPNIRNWKFIKRLLFKGDFHYTDSGVLDRTHLRFFVRQTASALATSGGLHLVAAHDARAYERFEFRNILNILTLGATRDLIAKQWIVIAERR